MKLFWLRQCLIVSKNSVVPIPKKGRGSVLTRERKALRWLGGRGAERSARRPVWSWTGARSPSAGRCCPRPVPCCTPLWPAWRRWWRNKWSVPRCSWTRRICADAPPQSEWLEGGSRRKNSDFIGQKKRWIIGMGFAALWTSLKKVQNFQSKMNLFWSSNNKA